MKVIYLSRSDPDPENGGCWVLIEENRDGRFYGTGFGLREGAQKIYISGQEYDESLEDALKAATEWAERSGVDAVYVRPL